MSSKTRVAIVSRLRVGRDESDNNDGVTGGVATVGGARYVDDEVETRRALVGSRAGVAHGVDEVVPCCLELVGSLASVDIDESASAAEFAPDGRELVGWVLVCSGMTDGWLAAGEDCGT